MDKIKIGTKVLCRFYNTPDKKFYGDYFQAEILDIIENHPFGGSWMNGWENIETAYVVKNNVGFVWTLKRKEIKRILE